MTEIIKFKAKDEINKELKIIFDEIDEYLNREDNAYLNHPNEYYSKLIKCFYDIYNKLKENRWDNKYNIKFLDSFKEITFDDDIENKYINQMEYIRLYDFLSGDLFKLNNEYIKILMYIGFELDEINEEVYKSVINLLENHLIKESIDKKEEFDEKLKILLDYIDYAEAGLNPIELAVSIINDKKENQKESIDDLSNGIMTIERIYNFYINQAYFCRSLFETFPSNQIFDNIKKIILIKNYSNIIQIKFIVLVQKFQEIEQCLDGRFKFMSDLVDIFLHYKEKIEHMDIDDLSNILFFKRINDLTMGETIENLLLDEKRL